MARVEWSRTAPDDVEHVVAVMLLREHPSAQRIRPSQGDGGIDVLVPSQGSPEVDVYQVKGFSSNLTSGQKSQIKRSYSRLLRTMEARDLRVRNWYLALPLDATSENLAWLKEITADADFHCEWRGLAFLDGLAADYPEVIDYYLRDGKDRLEAAVAALAKVVRMGEAVASDSEEKSIQPPDVVDGLAALHEELNRYDPHYRYDFSVDTVRPEVPYEPGQVFIAQIGDKHRTITFRVYARFHEATDERPIPIQVSWTVGDDGHTEQALREWLDFGTPFEAPLGSATLDLDLPGGLGGRVEGAAVKLGPAAGGKGYDLRLYIFDPAGEELVNVLVHMDPVSTGMSGAGVRASGTETNGVFDLEMRIALPDGGMTMNVSGSAELGGKRPAEILAGLRFLALFTEPNELRFGPAFGPPLPSGLELPARPATDRDDLLLRTVEALDTIQGVTQVQVFVPDLDTLSVRQALDLVQAGRLIRGETVVGTWESCDVRVQPDHVAESAPMMAVVLDESFSVMIGDTDVPLGIRRIHVTAAKLELLADTPGEDGLLPGRLVPGDGNRDATIRWVGPPKPPDAATQAG